jgi:hypothetical protein
MDQGRMVDEGDPKEVVDRYLRDVGAPAAA